MEQLVLRLNRDTARMTIAHAWARLAALLMVGLAAAAHVRAQYPSENVSLHSRLDLTVLDADSANDCWGYVSRSGREYALIGLNDKVTVVEITDPDNPAIVGSVPHANSGWADIKTYRTYAYAVNESGGGMDVIDLGDVDNGNVTLVQRMTTDGLDTSHNLAVDTTNGFLYLLGSNLNRGAPVAYSLNDPANPVEAGRWTEPATEYHHDARIVTYTTGPYAGRQIEFGFSEGRGIDIVDVTDKSDMFLLSRTIYPGVRYCHQGWTSPDLRYLYVTDELDEGDTTPTTRTLIFDVADLENPRLTATFTNNLPSPDHQVFVRDCLAVQANYTSGLRVISIARPRAPVEVGHFDTYPLDDTPSHNGAWSTYPYFPSGTVIVSDIQAGLFVLDISAAQAAADAVPGAVDIAFPAARPERIDPLGGTTLQVEASGRCGATVNPATATLYYDAGSGFVPVPMQTTGPADFTAAFPPAVCSQLLRYYVAFETTEGVTTTAPAAAPDETYSAISSADLIDVFRDDFEVDRTWTTGPDSATSGFWQRGDPFATIAQPERDHTPGDGAACYFTQQHRPNLPGYTAAADVDGGSVALASPAFDLVGMDAFIAYYRWYFERDDGDDAGDGFHAEISNDGGASWTTIEFLSPHSGGWERCEFLVRDLLPPTDAMKVRFTVSDGPATGDLIEAAIDDFSVRQATCVTRDPDINDDGAVDMHEIAKLQTCFSGAGNCPCVPALYGDPGLSPCTPTDIDVDGDIDANDLELVATALTGP